MTTLPGRTHVSSDPIADVAAWLAQRLVAPRARPPWFSIALAGGSTPAALYDHLAGDAQPQRWDWPHWEVFYGDERAVPPDDPQSNHHLAQTRLLSRVAVDPQHVHRMQAERADLDGAAQEYAQLLATTQPLTAGGAPRLDVVLLGLGENGHTASLFPGTAALEVQDTWATRGLADYVPYDRITVTFPTINAAAAIAFVVAGASKHQALRDVVAGTAPAARVRPGDGELHWFLDEVAAAGLHES